MSDGISSGAESKGLRATCAPVTLECIECHMRSDPAAKHWRGYRIDDPSEGEPPALAFYCPVCAEREFGELGPTRHEPRNMHW